MSGGHSHHHTLEDREPPAPAPVRALLIGATAFFALVTLIGIFVLWPSQAPRPNINGDLATTENIDATITKLDTHPCAPQGNCRGITVRIDSGAEAGHEVALPDQPEASTSPKITLGDTVVISKVTQKDTGDVTYNFVDLQRSRPLWLLAMLCAVVVVLIGRWRGLAAIGGLAVTWVVLIEFLIPGLLDGHNPVALALVSGSSILFVVLYLAHGVSARTTAALLGTQASLVLTGVLSLAFVAVAGLSGMGSEDTTYLVTNGINIDLAGLLLCGIIIGSLGALNDATVTQASAVWELHAANPARSPLDLYRSAMRIGRDHIASTIYTLVLAYAGSSLPLMILFVLGGQRFGEVITTEIVAEEVIRTLVGAIGLVASVPVTTALAAFIVTRASASTLPAGTAFTTVASGRNDETDNHRPGHHEHGHDDYAYNRSHNDNAAPSQRARSAILGRTVGDLGTRMYTRQSQWRTDRETARNVERRRPRPPLFDDD